MDRRPEGPGDGPAVHLLPDQVRWDPGWHRGPGRPRRAAPWSVGTLYTRCSGCSSSANPLGSQASPGVRSRGPLQRARSRQVPLWVEEQTPDRHRRATDTRRNLTVETIPEPHRDCPDIDTILRTPSSAGGLGLVERMFSAMSSSPTTGWSGQAADLSAAMRQASPLEGGDERGPPAGVAEQLVDAEVQRRRLPHRSDLDPGRADLGCCRRRAPSSNPRCFERVSVETELRGAARSRSRRGAGRDETFVAPPERSIRSPR